MLEKVPSARGALWPCCCTFAPGQMAGPNQAGSGKRSRSTACPSAPPTGATKEEVGAASGVPASGVGAGAVSPSTTGAGGDAVDADTASPVGAETSAVSVALSASQAVSVEAAKQRAKM